MMRSAEGEHNPIFIVCTARSGSTLLRYILDSHEWVDVPGELHLGPLVQEMNRVMSRLYLGSAAEAEEREALVSEAVRSHLDKMIRSRLKKKIWCDKSVSTVDHLDLMLRIFPRARYVFLYRNCLDFVHSALEVSKYGFTGYWFDEFVLKQPENIVEGLVRFWCAQTENRVAVANANEHAIYRLKYEDLVGDPGGTVRQLFGFLDLPYEESIWERVFANNHNRTGGGDLKIQSTQGIQNQVGKGRSVPVKLLKAETLERMNGLHAELGYGQVTEDWNFEEEGVRLSPERRANLIARIRNHLEERLTQDAPGDLIREEVLELEVKGLDAARWVLDFRDRICLAGPQSSKLPTLNIKLRWETLVELMDQSLNVSMALKHGRVATDAAYLTFQQVGNYLFG